MYPYNSVKLFSVTFQENTFSDSRIVTAAQGGGAFLQLFFPNALKLRLVVDLTMKVKATHKLVL
jgi:hypothetical protein